VQGLQVKAEPNLERSKNQGGNHGNLRELRQRNNRSVQADPRQACVLPGVFPAATADFCNGLMVC
jgi:hypothetical protein